MAVATVPVPECPVCGDPAARDLHDALVDHVFKVVQGRWRLVLCTGCGAARLDPRPTDEALPTLYTTYYTHAPPAVPGPPAGRLGRLRRAARNGRLNRHLGYALQPASPLGGRLLGLIPAVAAWIDRGVRSLPAGGKLLDVGCGNGHFLADAAAVGWEAVGIDVDLAAVAAGRAAGLEVTAEPLQALALREPGAYDAITASHVVEHVPDPVAFLGWCTKLLRPGGVIWVATPNLAADRHRLLGASWRGLDPPRHLVLFDASSLAWALGAAGLTRVQVQRPAFPALTDFVASGLTGRRGRLQALRADLAGQREVGRSEELVVVAHRPDADAG